MKEARKGKLTLEELNSKDLLPEEEPRMQSAKYTNTSDMVLDKDNNPFISDQLKNQIEAEPIQTVEDRSETDLFSQTDSQSDTTIPDTNSELELASSSNNNNKKEHEKIFLQPIVSPPPVDHTLGKRVNYSPASPEFQTYVGKRDNRKRPNRKKKKGEDLSTF